MLVAVIVLSVVVMVLSAACALLANSLHKAYSRFYEHAEHHGDKWAASNADFATALMTTSREYLELHQIQAGVREQPEPKVKNDPPAIKHPDYEPQGTFIANAG